MADHTLSSPAPFLFTEEVIQKLTADEERGIYTAERCPEHKRNAIIQLLGSGNSKRRICELLHVHRLTVVAIQEAQPEEVEAVRQRTSRKMRRCINDQLDRVEESPGIIPASSIAQFVGILTDKAELMEGRATARVEHLEAIDIYEDWPQFVEKQLAPGDVIEVDALVSPGTGLTGGKNLPIESPAPAGSGSGTDERSEDQDPIAQVTGQSDPTSIPASESGEPSSVSESGRLETPPGGDRRTGGQPDGLTGNKPQKICDNRSDQS